MIEIYIEADDKFIPFYAHEGDAGMDIRASEDVTILPGETKIVKTGLKIAVPKVVMIDVRPRSGLSAKTPLRVANTPGTIDSGYRDEIGVIISNTSFPFKVKNGMIIENDDKYDVNEKLNRHGIYQIKKGDRIAQIVFSNYIEANLVRLDDINKISGDRGGGFGHSGVK